MTIVNVRGTHGSGKSTLVRAVMDMYGHREPIYLPGLLNGKARRNPIGYVLSHTGRRSVFVLGSYEGDQGGGCDNVPQVAVMYKYIRRYANKKFHVLYEGILAQHGTPHIIKLHQDGFRVRVVSMDIPIGKAIKSIKRRRKARGNRNPFDATNTKDEVNRVRWCNIKLRAHGVRVTKVRARRDARDLVVRWLGASP